MPPSDETRPELPGAGAAAPLGPARAPRPRWLLIILLGFPAAIVAGALGVEPRIVHIPSEHILAGAPDWFWSELILGDLQHSVVLDNTKIRRYVPGFAPAITFPAAVPRMLAWRAEHGAATQPDPQTNEVLDRLVRGYHQAAGVFAALAPVGQSVEV